MGSIFMDKKKFTIAEKMKAVEAHIHEGAGCRCQESFTPYLLPIDFFATLCPIHFYLLLFARSLRGFGQFFACPSLSN